MDLSRYIQEEFQEDLTHPGTCSGKVQPQGKNK